LRGIPPPAAALPARANAEVSASAKARDAEPSLVDRKEILLGYVRGEQYVYPPLIAELKKNGLWEFCQDCIDRAPWSNSFAEGMLQPGSPLRARVDAGEVIRQRERGDDLHGLRLRKGHDEFELRWNDERTRVFIDPRGTSIYDQYRRVRVLWTGTLVLDLHMGGEMREADDNLGGWEVLVGWTDWHITMVKVYSPGAWLELIGPLSGSS
jgi:hypothetical protein